MNAVTLKNIKHLRGVPLFKLLPDDVLVELAEKVVTREWNKDEVLFPKGAPGDSMYVLFRGWVKIVTTDNKGDELVLNHCGPGESIGDVALIDGEPRSAGVVALVPVKALELKRDVFLDVFNRQPALALGMMRSLTAKIRLSTIYIEKAIEWSHRVANGDYSFMDQLNAEHETVVTMSRSDEARVGEFLAAFFRMVEGVKKREDTLKQQVVELTIKIDEARRKQEVDELTESSFFQNLKSASQKLRRQRSKGHDTSKS
jgi:CRP-like cAMP-binding protein